MVDRLGASSRLLILGSHGFIGAHLTRAAVESGHNVLGFSLPADLEQGERILRSLGISPPPAIPGDATDRQQVLDVLNRYQPDVIVNAVGRIDNASGDEPWLGRYSVNYGTATATVDAVAAVAPQDRPFVLWVGSQAEYGDAPSPWSESTPGRPATAYGLSKLMATEAVVAAIRADIIRGCVVRLPIVFGEAQQPTLVVAQLIVSSLAGQSLPMTAGQQTRMLAYAPDAARWMLGVAGGLLAEPAPPIVNLPGYEPMSIQSLVGLLDEALPNGTTADLGAMDYRANERLVAWPDTSLAESMGATRPTPIEHALRKTVDWYTDNPWFWKGRP